MAADTARPFGAVVRDLLIEKGIVTPIGNPNWPALGLMVAEVSDVRYESYRKAVTRDRWPSQKIMEAVAQALDVEPTIFWEYQLEQARQAFDPREVGDEAAYAALQAWLKARKRAGA